MALAQDVHRCNISKNSQDPSMVNVEIGATVSTDLKEARDAGISGAVYSLEAVAPREALEAFIAACKITNAAGWPEAVIALPAEKHADLVAAEAAEVKP